VCTVPAVQSKLRAGVDSYQNLQRALDSIGDTVPVIALDEPVNKAATELAARLDLGEAQAFAVADIHDGTLVTDDGPSQNLARDADVAVTGSIGVLLRAMGMIGSLQWMPTAGSHSGSTRQTTEPLPVTSPTTANSAPVVHGAQ
jgi:hypothetical protein